MTAYHSLFDVIKDWFWSVEFNKYDTLYDFRFLWIARSGQLIQFFAALTITAEIIGRERISMYKKNVNGIVDLRKTFIVFVAGATKFKLIYRYFTSKFPLILKENQIYRISLSFNEIYYIYYSDLSILQSRFICNS